MKKYKKIFLLSLFVMLEFFAFRLNVYADYNEVYSDSSNMVKLFSADTYSNEKIFNLKIRTSFFYSPRSDNHTKIEEFRRYAYEQRLRDPDNPSKRLNPSEYKPLQVSSRLGVIASIRDYEREFNNVYYRLDGKYYNTLYIGGLNSDCEYLNDSTDLFSVWLEKEQTKWINGEKTSDLYKYLISSKYKSYNVVGNLFEFSKKSDDETYENNESYYTIPIKSSKILYKLESPTYISKGNAYPVTTSLYLWNDNDEEFESVYVRNEEYISSENNDIIDAYKNHWDSMYVAGKNIGEAKVNVWLESGPKITFNVGVDQIVTSNPPQNDRNFAGEWTKYNNDWYYRDSYGDLVTGWKIISNNTYYFAPNNVMQKEWKQISSKWYYLGQNGALRKGWFEVNNSWYYSDSDGIMQKNSWIGNYYVNSNGSMAKNQWIGNYYVDSTGKWVPNKTKVTEGWHKTEEGAYWYQNSDGSYPKKQWKEIGKRWYHFNENGYMDHNKWIGDYYVKASGEMATNEWIGKYYVDSTGKLVPNKTKVTAGWHKTKEGAYWYQNSDGSYPKKQWQKINTHWYHFNDKGYMDHDKWIGYYYVKSSGEMATNEWIDKFYVDGTGKWDPKKVDTSYGWRKTKEGAFWYQEKNGSFPKNQWKQIDGQWYHFNESGYMDHDKWIGYYYVKSSGEMATNERIGIFYVGSDGLWQPGV